MAIKSEHVIILGSLDRQDRMEQLEGLIEMTKLHGDWDIIVDLSDITISSRVIGALVQLREIGKTFGREIILCGIDSHVKSVFTVSGLDGLFPLCQDKAAAMSKLDEIRQPAAAEII